MEEVERKKNAYYYIGFVSGILAIAVCIVTIGFSVSNMYHSIYTLCIALMLLGVNRVGLHLSNFKQNLLENISLTEMTCIVATY